MGIEDKRIQIQGSHLIQVAERLGSQGVDVCPTDDHICWRHRSRRPYHTGDECVECWIAFLLEGV